MEAFASRAKETSFKRIQRPVHSADLNFEGQSSRVHTQYKAGDIDRSLKFYSVISNYFLKGVMTLFAFAFANGALLLA